MSSIQPPEDVLDAIKILRTLKDKRYPTREDTITLNRAKVRIAYWVCRVENIVASRENLAYVLGNDAAEIMKTYDKYLDSSRQPAGPGKGGKTPRKIDPRFWGGS